MISVNQALSLILSTEITSKSKTLPITEAFNKTLAVNIHSPIDMPPFRQSAMDGYAVKLSDSDSESFLIKGEIKAGDSIDYNLQPGEGVRIFTGARVPDDADCIIIQEDTIKIDNRIKVNKTYKKGQNIRPIGEQIKAKELALEKGSLLTPASIGFLAGLGISEVHVYTPPSVAIIVTGNELVTVGSKLTDGKVYESNSIQLQAALKNEGIEQITHYKVEDEYSSTVNTIINALEYNDLILISGGISVGDYDFVGKALEELKTQEIFYKVKQKPGKPLFYGINQSKHIFALPGNPASSLTCFYMYVIPLIHRLSGRKKIGLQKDTARLKEDLIKQGDRAQFFKAYVHNRSCQILGGQNSSMLNTFSLANALAYLPEDKSELKEGEDIEVYIIN